MAKKTPAACFNGTLAQLMAQVAATGLDGNWIEDPNGCWRFRRDDRSSLHWSETRRTIWFDGPDQARRQLEARIGSALARTARRTGPVADSGIELEDGLELVVRRRDAGGLVLHVNRRGVRQLSASDRAERGQRERDNMLATLENAIDGGVQGPKPRGRRHQR